MIDYVYQVNVSWGEFAYWDMSTISIHASEESALKEQNNILDIVNKLILNEKDQDQCNIIRNFPTHSDNLRKCLLELDAEVIRTVRVHLDKFELKP